MKLVRKTGLVFAALAASATGTLIAQSAVDGAIGGTIEDGSGAKVSGATVVVRNNGTNAVQTINADASGFFRAIHLQPGLYTVTVNATGFAAFKSDMVEVTVGSLTDIEPKLGVSGSSETVEVTSETPAINTTNNDFANTIDLKVLEDLPVNNYRWSAYALLTPGVVADSSGFGLLSFRGQSTLLNNITFDGMDDNQAFFSEERGRTRVGYSTAKASILEFQVNTSNYTVEYGRSAGGVVNAVTRSGTNQFHGEAYFYDRDAEFGAKNPFNTISLPNAAGVYTTQVFKPKDWRKQTGIGIGGPIIKDKLFFFFAFDKFLRNFPGVSAPSSPNIFYATVPTTGPGTAAQPCVVPAGSVNATNPQFSLTTAASAAAAVCNLASNLNGTPAVSTFSGRTGSTGIALANVNAAQYTAAYNIYTTGISTLSTEFGLTPRTGDQDIFFPKLDYQINGRNHLTLELNRLRWTSPAGIQTSTSALSYGRESFGNDFVKDTFIIGKLDTLINQRLSNEVRYQYGRDLEYEYNQTPTAYETNTLLTPPGYTNPYGIPPLVSITNAFGSGFGTATFLNRPAYPDERRWQLADTANYVKGNHNIKFGADFLHTYDLSENLTAVFGSFSYTGSNYLALSQYFTDQNKSNACTSGVLLAVECYSSYQQGFGPLGFNFVTQDYAGFLQDEWKVAPRLSLTLGIRYEYEQTPSPQIPNASEAVTPFINGSTNAFPDNRTNIGPRVGFAFDPFRNGKTSIRGGYGEFFARLENSTIYNAIAQTGNPLGQLSVNFASSNGTATAAGKNGIVGPVFPQILSTATNPSGATAVFYFDKNFKMPEIQQADLTVEQDIGYNSVLGVTWLYSGGRRLPDFVDSNLPSAPTDSVSYTVVGGAATSPVANGISPLSPLTPGQVITIPYYKGTRPNTALGATTDIFSGVNSNYEAVVFQFKHNTTRNLSFATNYTWSHALDYGENNTTFTATNLLLDPHNLRADYGNSNQNVPNRIVAYAIYNTPSAYHGFLGYLLNNYELAPSFSGQSGLPYSAGVSGGNPTPVDTAGASILPASTAGGINGTGGAARVYGLDRNIFKYKRDLLLDARVSKRFKVRERYNVELLVESFNIFNHLNQTNVASTNSYSLAPGTPASGTKAATPNTLTYNNAFGAYNPQTFQGNANNNFIYSPRQVQGALRVQF